jgi:ankyrin repeat protein
MRSTRSTPLDIAHQRAISSHGAAAMVDHFYDIMLTTQFYVPIETQSDGSSSFYISTENSPPPVLYAFQSFHDLQQQLNQLPDVPDVIQNKQVYGWEILLEIDGCSVSFYVNNEYQTLALSEIVTIQNSLLLFNTIYINEYKINCSYTPADKPTLLDQYFENNVAEPTLIQTLANMRLYLPIKSGANIESIMREDIYIVHHTKSEADSIIAFDRLDRAQNWAQLKGIECQIKRLNGYEAMQYAANSEGLLLNPNHTISKLLSAQMLAPIFEVVNTSVNLFFKRDSYFHLGICEAALVGNIEAIQYHLEHGVSHDVRTNDKFGNAPIHQAAQAGHIDIVRILIEYGCPINLKQNFSWRPIHYAASNGYTEMFKMLIEYKADLKAVNGYGFSPIHLAAQEGYIEIVNILLKQGIHLDTPILNADGNTPLQVAAQNGHIKLVEILIKHGANINKKQRHGWTALMLAAQFGQTAVVRFLLQRDADTTIREHDAQMNAENIAEFYGMLEVAKLIHSHCENVTFIN